jgi:transposase
VLTLASPLLMEAPLIGMERRVLLRHYLEQGLKKSEIARLLDMSRDTIYRMIRTGDLDRDPLEVRYGPRAPVPSKLDAFKPIIEARLQEFPELSSVRLFEEIRAAGFTGSLTRLRVFVRTIRPQPAAAPVVRFETEPARQAQVDFAHFRFPWGIRYALLVVLGYSRLLWLRFFAKQDMRTVYQGLEQAFTFFGGVPAELLFDQMRSVIVRDLRPEGGRLIENAEFLRFCAHWDFRPRACRPYRAQTKGKVERPIRYVRSSFVYGRTFTSDSDLNAQAEHWLATTANVRQHATTGEQPLLRFERDEKALLRPLALRPYQSLVLPIEQARSKRAGLLTTPLVDVERRSLASYDAIAGGAR